MGGDPAEARLARLVRDHHGQVLAYLRRRLDDWHTAEELAAETFVVAWRRMETVPEPALPWLYTAARGLLMNEYRKRERRAAARSHLPPVPATAGDPSVALAGTDRVQAALARLPARDRELLMLIGWEELSVREAAVVLSVAPSVVSVRLFRARRRLTARLEEIDQEMADVLSGVQGELRRA
jgi:RNA polymerase sigma-70 factor (ECF subfamily)